MKITGKCTFWELAARLRCCMIIQHLSSPMGAVLKDVYCTTIAIKKWDKCFIKSTWEFINAVSFWT